MFKKSLASFVVLLVSSICGVGSTFGDIITSNFDPDTNDYHQFDSSLPAAAKTLGKTGGGFNSANAINIGFDTTGTTGGNLNYFTNLGNSFVGTAVSNSASNFTLSFDIVADGLAIAGATFQTNFKLNGTQFQSNSVTATGTYNNVSLNLGAMTVSGTAFSASQVNTTGGTRQLQFVNFNLTQAWGIDSGNGVRIDNIRLVETAAVPEPSSFLTFGAIAGLTLLRRNRRSR